MGGLSIIALQTLIFMVPHLLQSLIWIPILLTVPSPLDSPLWLKYVKVSQMLTDFSIAVFGYRMVIPISIII